MNTLDAIMEAPPEQGRYFLVIKAENGRIGTIPLILDGSERQVVAASRFADACVVARQEIAKECGWTPCNYHVDGQPRTEYELACDAYLKKTREIGWDDVESTPEFQKVMALRPAKNDPYWTETGEVSNG